MKHTYDKHNLIDYISKQMRMSHIYQPVVIRALLENGGQATTEEIAKSVGLQLGGTELPRAFSQWRL
ncbi:hypothetical protein [Lentibacter algarum]|uniref:hypothetical protein n=1 Tax=Lentibacter algarum TaxID=576131 RepID=UPI000B7C948D|nr:hypothetical protein [Lentibacter algarum]